MDRTDALEGKTIGWYETEFTSPWGDQGTANAMKEEFQFFEPGASHRVSTHHTGIAAASYT